MRKIEKAIVDLEDLKRCEFISSDFFAVFHGEQLHMGISALEKQMELSQIIADIKKDFNKNDTYSVSLVLELLESVRIGGKSAR